MLNSAELLAAARARELIAATVFFDELGVPSLAAGARIVAADLLEFATKLERERAGRIAARADYARVLSIIGAAAYDQVDAAVKARRAPA